MSHLESVVRHQLKLNKEFTFLGEDGAYIQAHDLDGVLAVHIVDRHGKTLFDHYTDFRNLLNHLALHGGHIH
jgi:hypothetical protein